MAKDLISTGEAIELFFQMTLGSTFNPDRITGINAYIFPAFTELGISADTSFQITDRNIGPIRANIELKSPLAFINGPDIYE
ncbi:hypothetical protein RZS08_61640, partial [Arthrospira platensis SPKY1]|nr:hypothetical protein [Arthrospira platensis SPKY1]